LEEVSTKVEDCDEEEEVAVVVKPVAPVKRYRSDYYGGFCPLP